MIAVLGLWGHNIGDYVEAPTLRVQVPKYEAYTPNHNYTSEY